MSTHPSSLGRLLACVLAGAFVAGGASAQIPKAYADPAKPALPNPGMQLDLSRTALVVIDPQIDFMSAKGAAWSVVGESVTEQNLVPNLTKLFKASKAAGIVVSISPHSIIRTTTSGNSARRSRSSSTISISSTARGH